MGQGENRETIPARELSGLVLHVTSNVEWGVERVQRTYSEEFYQITESSFDIAQLGNELSEWERTYATVRPHQALNYLTLLKFLERWKESQEKEVTCH